MTLKIKNAANDQLGDDPAGDSPRSPHPAGQRLESPAEAAQPPEATLDLPTQGVQLPAETVLAFEHFNATQARRGMRTVSQAASRQFAWSEQLKTIVGGVLMRRIRVVRGISQQIASGVLLGQMIDQFDGALLVRDVQRSHDQRVGHRRASPGGAQLVTPRQASSCIPPSGIAVLGEPSHHQRLAVDPPTAAKQLLPGPQSVIQRRDQHAAGKGFEPATHGRSAGQTKPCPFLGPVDIPARPADRPIVQDSPEKNQHDDTIGETNAFWTRTELGFLEHDDVKCAEQFAFHGRPPCLETKGQLGGELSFAPRVNPPMKYPAVLRERAG